MIWTLNTAILSRVMSLMCWSWLAGITGWVSICLQSFEWNHPTDWFLPRTFTLSVSDSMRASPKSVLGVWSFIWTTQRQPQCKSILRRQVTLRRYGAMVINWPISNESLTYNYQIQSRLSAGEIGEVGPSGMLQAHEYRDSGYTEHNNCQYGCYPGQFRVANSS